MEAHPVPKNVLTVEFKLFGPLTVNQFFKILMGSILGLVVFAITPAALRLFALPIIVICVGLGIMAALIEGFEVKLMGLIKAVFSTTQYVWSKNAKVPDVLTTEAKKAKPTAISSATSSATDFDDIAIDTLLSARRAVVNQAKQTKVTAAQNNQTGESNTGSEYFDKIYNQAFAGQTHEETVQNRQSAIGTVETTGGLASPAGKQVVAMGQNMQVVSQAVKNDAQRGLAPVAVQSVEKVSPQATVGVEEVNQDKIHDLTLQITSLKEQLKSQDPEQRKIATERIKTLFEELQHLAHPHAEQATHSHIEASSTNLFGVVVDKNGTPIAGAEASLVSSVGASEALSKAYSKTDGTFSLMVQDDWQGEYFIEVKHPNYRFPEFKVDITKKNMGYKFRAI